MSDYHRELATYSENISDDFHSTFAVVSKNKLSNMMFKSEIPKVENIIKYYIPDAKLKFTKTNEMGEDEDYDIYLIELTS